jgi:hypothetical protein
MTTASSFEYIETSQPAGITIAEYRAARPPRVSRLVLAARRGRQLRLFGARRA